MTHKQLGGKLLLNSLPPPRLQFSRQGM